MNLINGTGPLVYKGMVMLPIGRPLTDPKSKVLKAGVTDEGLPMVDGENCVLDPKRKTVKGKDGKPVLLYPNENLSSVEPYNKSNTDQFSDLSEDELDEVEATKTEPPVFYDSEDMSDLELDVMVESVELKDLKEEPLVVGEASTPKLMAGLEPGLEEPLVVGDGSTPKLMAGLGPFAPPGEPGKPKDQDPGKVAPISPTSYGGKPSAPFKPDDRKQSPSAARADEPLIAPPGQPGKTKDQDPRAPRADKPKRRKQFIRPGVIRVCPDGTLKGRDNKPILDVNRKPIMCPIVNGQPKTDNKMCLVDKDGQRFKGPDKLPIKLGQGSHGPRVGPSGTIYKPEGSPVVLAKKKPLTAGFVPDGRVRVNRHGAIKGPDRKKLVDRKSDRVYVSMNP